MENLLYERACWENEASPPETSQTHAKTVIQAVCFVLYRDALEGEMIVSLDWTLSQPKYQQRALPPLSKAGEFADVLSGLLFSS